MIFKVCLYMNLVLHIFFEITSKFLNFFECHNIVIVDH